MAAFRLDADQVAFQARVRQLAAVTLHEFLTPVQLVGAAVVLCSVAILQLRPRRRSSTGIRLLRRSEAAGGRSGGGFWWSPRQNSNLRHLEESSS